MARQFYETFAAAKAWRKADFLRVHHIRCHKAELFEKAKTADLVIIDVRHQASFEADRLPHARSLQLEELKNRFKTLPIGKTIIAYCRGPYCFWAGEAVALLRTKRL